MIAVRNDACFQPARRPRIIGLRSRSEPDAADIVCLARQATAAGLSLLIPGSGQMFLGRIIAALVWLAAAVVIWFLPPFSWLSVLIVHSCAAIHALFSRVARRRSPRFNSSLN